MLFYDLTQIVNDLCCQIYFTLIGVFYQIVILIFKQLYLCVFYFYQCASSIFVVTYIELNSIVMLRLQNTVLLYTKSVSVKLAVSLLRGRSDFSEFLRFLA